MSAPQLSADFIQTVDRLVDLSINTYYNPYNRFQWVDSLTDEQWWMSPDLMTVYDTPFMEELSESQLMALSKWESINFYSLNIHGIRELLLEVTKRIHSPGYESQSEFYHHFLGEENEHMWFFGKFCLKYGSKIYPDKSVKINTGTVEPAVEDFLVFARILIFEEIVDYFNTRMGKDDRLHPLIREINAVHHQDESRHVAFGRQLVRQLHAQLATHCSAERMLELEKYLRAYIDASIHSFYNPAVYRDAAIAEPYKFRARLLQDPSRKRHHRQFLKRTMDYLVKCGIITQEDDLYECN